MSRAHRVLCLDGGGSKGVYTLGVLDELERKLGGAPLCTQFAAIYGTSTGSIIAGALAIGMRVSEVSEMYLAHIPKIMSHFTVARRDGDLRSALTETFGDRGFDDCRCDLGIVTTDVHARCARVFKSNTEMAHGRKASFAPGFGCTLVDAIAASCSAFPLFSRKAVKLHTGAIVELIDGGFVANNPSMIAYVDAIRGFGRKADELRIVSVGVGNFAETRPLRGLFQGARMLGAIELMSIQLAASANHIERMFEIVCDPPCRVRVNDSFPDKGLATNLLERNGERLRRIQEKGRDSFAKHEKSFETMFGPGV